jgi:hypothetical protein
MRIYLISTKFIAQEAILGIHEVLGPLLRGRIARAPI